MDAIESPLSNSPSPSNSFSPQCHFYLAVDRLQFKMETLVDLLGMAGRRPCLPMVVCCSTRDELDAVCSAVSNLSSYVYVSSLYSDLSEAERVRILDNFRQATGRWNRMGRDEVNGETEKKEDARILVNYELPTKKEMYTRRMTACLAADGIVINMLKCLYISLRCYEMSCPLEFPSLNLYHLGQENIITFKGKLVNCYVHHVLVPNMSL
ncbi:unnamed protein product [Fraxinus pennsylvanica]|uniref:Uncharacterized protein n=1 Tax=Fraxinus pennsylvanica TaxID=56036 RepID=A0AAD2A952_9LAMI|nr:unnamed protein product [Fraxinus pennsylvanica]